MIFSDAEDAVKYRDGYDIDGYRLRVEFTRGVGPRGPGGRPLHGEDDRGGRGDFRRRSPKAAPPRRTGYRVLVTGTTKTYINRHGTSREKDF